MSGTEGDGIVDETLAVRVREALIIAGNHLNDQRTPGGPWCGELSSSALSTATALFTLELYSDAPHQPRTEFQSLISRGTEWLARNVNPDGGWGDTTRSPSNLSTTTLVWAALKRVAARLSSSDLEACIRGAEAYLSTRAGSTERRQLAGAIIARYGKDRTFSVPILTMAALSSSLGEGPDAWREVISLPFELSAFPSSWYAALKLPVVSYALPALIAIGLVRHRKLPSRNPVLRWIRNASIDRALRVLEGIQPSNGGVLEATPLTSFVAMSLVGAGLQNHPVTEKCVRFLVASARSDGSWPIDTDLEVWVTTLSLNAMGRNLWRPPDHRHPDDQEKQALLQWLLKAQYSTTHPYTQARPGGWAWTTKPGGVPDADDTSGALIALRNLDPAGEQCGGQALRGVRWLMDLQNRDGGVPTFCKGWGHLPFDRSSPDITAHALRAWALWSDACTTSFKASLISCMRRALIFLKSSQRTDGSWAPLWFGNDRVSNEENPTYGTSRVVVALASLNHGFFCEAAPLLKRGMEWLFTAQGVDGGWGGAPGIAPSMEETAMALEAVVAGAIARANAASDRDASVRSEPLGPEIRQAEQLSADRRTTESVQRGFNWLERALKTGTCWDPAPIGFYFARLWYWERLYPGIHCLAALNKMKMFVELLSPTNEKHEDR